MGQLKVRFTIVHDNHRTSFTNRNELEQQSFSDLLINRLDYFEQCLKQAAAKHLIDQRIGRENNFIIKLGTSESE